MGMSAPASPPPRGSLVTDARILALTHNSQAKRDPEATAIK